MCTEGCQYDTLDFTAPLIDADPVPIAFNEFAQRYLLQDSSVCREFVLVRQHLHLPGPDFRVLSTVERPRDRPHAQMSNLDLVFASPLTNGRHIEIPL